MLSRSLSTFPTLSLLSNLVQATTTLMEFVVNRLLLLMPEHFIRQVHPLMSSLLKGVDIIPVSVTEKRETILEEVALAHFLVWTGMEISQDMLTSATNLLFIQKWGSGTDGIDLTLTARLGIPVSNVPGANAVSAAEHFFGLMLALYKRLFTANAFIHSGRWPQAELMDYGIGELRGKILGLVGFGHIGRAIAERAIAFGMELIYNKRFRLNSEEEHKFGVSFVPLSTLVQQADIVGLALPLTPETKGLFNYEIFNQMKPSAILINVARGTILNEMDLYHAIVDGRLAGAGLDVFETEPPSIENPLFQLQSVIATPHIAGRSREAIVQISSECASNVLLMLEGKQPQHRVI